MKFLIAAIFLGLFATLALCDETNSEDLAIYDRPCQVREDELSGEVRTPFSGNFWSGPWFERETYRWEGNLKLECLISRYSWNFISRSLDIDRTGIFVNRNDDDEEHNENSTIFRSNAIGFLAFPDASPIPGLVNVTYDDGVRRDRVNYYVLGTDYYSYAVTWSCEDLPNDQSREYAWVLTRVPELNPEVPEDAETLSRIESYIDRHLDREFLEMSDQSDDLCRDLR